MVGAEEAYRRAETPEELLEKYLSGDDEAFGVLVGLYEEKLYAFLERLTGDPHLAEDAFQSTFLKVSEKAHTFDRRASFSTWLYRIARNTALDELRRRRRAPFQPDPDLGGLDNIAEETTAPLDKMALDEQIVRVRVAVAALPEAQREAFILKEEGDLSFDEIGEILECGRETAKSRFRLAIEKLRAALGVRD